MAEKATPTFLCSLKIAKIYKLINNTFINHASLLQFLHHLSGVEVNDRGEIIMWQTDTTLILFEEV